MIAFVKSERGSSSILVAMVLIILVVFAALAISTSSANLKLAKKNSETIKAFYSLDSQGERVVYQVKKSLKDSMVKADEVMAAINRGESLNLDLPDALSADLQSLLKKAPDKMLDQSQQEMLYPKLVIHYARLALEKVYPGCLSTLSEANDASHADDSAKIKLKPGFNFKTSIIMMDDEQIQRYLNIQISVVNPQKGKSFDEICVIKEWRLWQEPFEYKNEVDLWEGKP